MSSSTVTKPPDLVQLVITVTDPLQFTLKVALSEVRSVDYALNMLAQAERMLMAERRNGQFPGPPAPKTGTNLPANSTGRMAGGQIIRGAFRPNHPLVRERAAREAGRS